MSAPFVPKKFNVALLASKTYHVPDVLAVSVVLVLNDPSRVSRAFLAVNALDECAFSAGNVG